METVLAWFLNNSLSIAAWLMAFFVATRLFRVTVLNGDGDRPRKHGIGTWEIIARLSGLLGILSFLIQIAQWLWPAHP
ncbi:MAG: hypothetical protein JNJ73_08595 [Hyphomonadaceae bacterium]|nr:hypothetical protein [Hyphomonadaceae bacterium]